MGTCFGHCFRNTNSRRHDRCYSFYRCKTQYVQFGDAEGSRGNNNRHLWLHHRLTSLLSLKRKKNLQEEVALELAENLHSFQFCDRHMTQSCIPCHHFSLHITPSGVQPGSEFQPLDAKALLGPHSHAGFCLTQENKSLHSTPPSSIDLEWEHEAYCNPRSLKDDEEESESTGMVVNNNFRSYRYYKSVHKLPQVGSRQGSITLDSSITGSREGSRMTTPDSLEWDFVDPSIPTIDQETEQLIAEIERLAANALEETGNYDVGEVRDSFLDGDVS